MIEHPGTILARRMPRRQFGVCSLGRTIGCSAPNISNILHCRRGYTAETALQLDCAFGDAPGTWWKYWTDYQLERALEIVRASVSR